MSNEAEALWAINDTLSDILAALKSPPASSAGSRGNRAPAVTATGGNPAWREDPITDGQRWAIENIENDTSHKFTGSTKGDASEFIGMVRDGSAEIIEDDIPF